MIQNQAGNLDQGIEDASEHFVYVPKRCTVNAQDMAFFLSTRLVTAAGGENNNDSVEQTKAGTGGGDDDGGGGGTSTQYYGGEEPSTRLRRYEGLRMEWYDFDIIYIYMIRCITFVRRMWSQ